MYVRFRSTAGGEQLPVAVSTLDEELAGQAVDEPVLVKIDVQGTEDRVIAGGTVDPCSRGSGDR